MCAERIISGAYVTINSFLGRANNGSILSTKGMKALDQPATQYNLTDK